MVTVGTVKQVIGAMDDDMVIAVRIKLPDAEIVEFDVRSGSWDVSCDRMILTVDGVSNRKPNDGVVLPKVLVDQLRKVLEVKK